ncbi:phosphoribosyl-AMP cyclohydrolase [Candidatus Symbiobacter mobilis]|uniref:Phosphoribosyl-AMP cyclohydrolase n=1 Tax=Candidatus Symbiobacter mobilis CR TaxID=946483 RepID=U5N5T5_9BURK|nr:phosphoribosyl-AMP cyclohydrolase [Candidatus Symbiobacter mobilis]AGX86846.1 phosphoribosyl-AMP cyclohydrolase [Candidatus Symbiobacter mobilis CR]
MTHPAFPSDVLDAIHWDANGLVPVVVQERDTADVLMVAWMDCHALEETIRSGNACYYSRSRQRLWRKGEESGHVQRVHRIAIDCDADVLLLTVTQLGHTPSIACHTGHHSCFYRVLEDGAWTESAPVLKHPDAIYRSPA